jgi:hypothetical protein
VMEEEAQLDLWEGQRDGGSAGQQPHTKARLYSDPSSVAVPLSRCPAELQHAVDHIRTRYGVGALRTVPFTAHRSSLSAPDQATTIFPNVALPSMTR